MSRPGHYPGVEARGSSIRVVFQYEGRRCRETLRLIPTPDNLKQAARLRERLRQQIAFGTFDYAASFPGSRRARALGRDRRSRVPTFAALAEQWLGIKRDECQHSTVGGYEDALRKHLLPVLGERPIDTLIYSELAGLVASLDCPQPKTRNNILTPLRGVFELAVRDGLIADNPARHLRNRRVQKAPPDPFTQAEMQRILAAFAARGEESMRNYFEFAFCTGLRTSELIALTWADVDWLGQAVHVRQARVRNRLKGTKTYCAREIELGRHALAVLRRQAAISFRDDDLTGCVFTDPATGRGFADDRVQRERYWYPVLDRLGIRRRPAYNTRHTFATLALLAGGNPMWVSRQLGHANMRLLLDTYSRWIDGADRGSNRARLDALFNAPPGMPAAAEIPQPA